MISKNGDAILQQKPRLGYTALSGRAATGTGTRAWEKKQAQAHNPSPFAVSFFSPIDVLADKVVSYALLNQGSHESVEKDSE